MSEDREEELFGKKYHRINITARNKDKDKDKDVHNGGRFKYKVTYARKLFLVDIGFRYIRISTSLFSDEKKETDPAWYLRQSVMAVRDKSWVIYLLLFGEGFDPERIKCYTYEKKEDGTVISDDRLDKTLPAMMITGQLERGLPEVFQNESKPEGALSRYIFDKTESEINIAAFSSVGIDRRFDGRMAGLYSYLYAKSKKTGFERFIFFWMSLAALMIHEDLNDPDNDNDNTNRSDAQRAMHDATDSRGQRAFATRWGLLKGEGDKMTKSQGSAMYLLHEYVYKLFQSAVREEPPLRAEDFADLDVAVNKLAKVRDFEDIGQFIDRIEDSEKKKDDLADE